MAINMQDFTWVNGVTQRNAANMNQLQQGAKAACDGVDALNKLVTDEYTQRVYTVGDYCIKNNVLYKCTTEIDTPETWTTSHWTATTIDTEIKTLNNDLSDIIFIRTYAIVTNGIATIDIPGVKSQSVVMASTNQNNANYVQKVICSNDKVTIYVANNANGATEFVLFGKK